MRPTSYPNNNPKPCTPTSSKCVVWEGTLASCIEACPADSITDIIEKISQEVCAIKTSSPIVIGINDMACLPLTYVTVRDVNGVETQQLDLSLSTVIKTLIGKHCSLKQTVDGLISSGGTGGTGNVIPLIDNVNVTCLGAIKGLEGGISTGATNDQVIQYIINGLCSTWNRLSLEVNALNAAIAAIPSGGGGTTTQVSVTSACLFTGSRVLSQAWTALDTNYCAYKEKLGSTTEVDDALTAESVWISDINNTLLTPMGEDPIVGALTLARTVENLWLVIGTLNSRLTSTALALSACCGFSCKKFEVLVNALNFNSAESIVDLRFTFDGSSVLPGAPYTFVDEGSTVTFTDHTGFSLAPIIIDITDSATYTEMDITGLDIAGEIQVDIDLQYSVEDETDPTNVRNFNCTKCLHTYFKTNIACSFCTLLVTIIGDEPEVKINYSVAGSSTVNSLLLTTEGANMEYILPANSTIISIVNANNSSVTVTSSNCPNLTIPDVSALACYAFNIDDAFYSLNTAVHYYDIVGFMVDGVDLFTYSSSIPSDLHGERAFNPAAATGYTNVTVESETGCAYEVLSDSLYPTYFDSIVKLKNIPSNNYVFDIVKVCTTMNGTDMSHHNILVKGISGKNIFLKMIASDSNTSGTTLNDKPEVYIKGVEIPQGGSCDCCYVYNAT
jgi:hypothetical protein